MHHLWKFLQMAHKEGSGGAVSIKMLTADSTSKIYCDLRDPTAVHQVNCEKNLIRGEHVQLIYQLPNFNQIS